MNRYKKVSFFSGCGGSSEGFHQVKNQNGDSRFEELLAVEIDKHAVLSFNLNHPSVPVTNIFEYRNEDRGFNDFEVFAVGSTIRGRLLKWTDYIDYANELKSKMSEYSHLDFDGLKDLDLLAASPPCQDFSMSNTKRSTIDALESEKNNLFFETIRLIEEARPKVFVIENVPGMMVGKMKRAFFWILQRLRKTGYKFTYKILFAPEYGVPQKRNRIIFMGVRPDLAEMGFKPTFPTKQSYSINELSLESVATSLNEEVPGYFNSMQFQRQFIPADEICHTITKTSGMMFYSKDRLNKWKPSIEIIKKVSGFPKDYMFYGDSYVQSWARIGNAAPPPIMKAIGETIADEILEPYYRKIS